MAKLHFYYAVMNAGKSTQLLSTHHNYTYNGGNVLLFTSNLDNRSGVGKISSRIGLEAEAVALGAEDQLFDMVAQAHKLSPVTAVLMDEVQFMTPGHIEAAARVVNELGIPVLAFGLKNNVFRQLFSDAIATLLALADDIREVKQVCHCGSKATQILRYGSDGSPEKSGNVIEIGGESRYVSVCSKHWVAGDIGPTNRTRISQESVVAIPVQELSTLAH